jgi:eukaryotic-like serine/threonine-protein kinase
MTVQGASHLPLGAPTVRSLHLWTRGAPLVPSALEDPSFDAEQARLAATRVGQFLRRRWHLDSLIGVGGMASVYAATHRNGKRVAIKILHPELSTDAGSRRRFVDEGYVANRVGHPGTVSVLDDGETREGLVFLVMDLLEGQTLEERLRKCPTLHPREVVALAEGLLDVLVAAHGQGIVHRDIKPANVFIMRDGTVKLLDFGIASLIEPGHPRTTQSGMTMGTPEFMLPEQARGHCEQVDARTDIWAVGATMFTALTGRPVHAAGTLNEELLSAMTNRAPSLGDVVPRAPKRLVALVDRAMAFDPGKRWPTARAMQAALQEAQDELESQPPPSERTAEGPRSPNGSLVPRALWLARSRSWYVLPTGGVSDIFKLAKRLANRRRRWILAGAAASTLALVGAHKGHAPPPRTDTPSMPAPNTTLPPTQAVEPKNSAVADVDDWALEAPAPSPAASANKRIRSVWQARKPEAAERKGQDAPGELATPAPTTGPPSREIDPLSRRY